MNNYSYWYEEGGTKFKFYVNDALAYSFDDCDPMTLKEADKLCSDLIVEYEHGGGL